MEKIKKFLTWIKVHPISSFFCTLAIGITCGIYLSAVRKWDMEANEIGDAFGYWNSIFSGVALIGVVVSIAFQSKELKLQRDELEKTSKALNGQLDQQRKENFEATFFRTLDLLQLKSDEVQLPNFLRSESRSLVPDILMSERERSMSGIHVFDEILDFISKAKPDPSQGEKIIQFRVSDYHEPERMPNSEFIDWLWGMCREELGQYYRVLFNLLEMIEEAHFLSNQRRYANLIRATLRKSQIVLLAFNCASAEGKKQMQPLVVKWRILKYLPEKTIRRFGVLEFYPNGTGAEWNSTPNN